MIYIETIIESTFWYPSAKEFRQDLESTVEMNRIIPLRNAMPGKNKKRFWIEKDKDDDMKKCYYKSTYAFKNREEAEEYLSSDVMKDQKKILQKSHFSISQRVYEIKDKMFTIGEE
jgi:hypothetical protein